MFDWEFLSFLTALIATGALTGLALINGRLKRLKRNLELLRDEAAHRHRETASSASLLAEQHQKILELAALLQETQKNQSRMVEDNADLGLDVRAIMFALDSALELGQLTVHRVMPVRLYVSEDDERAFGRLEQALNEFLHEFGYGYSDSYPIERGSIFKRLWARTARAMSGPEHEESRRKMQKALEIKTLEHPQSQINLAHAEAVSKLMAAAEPCSTVALHVGSILLIKQPGADGEPVIHVKTLSMEEMLFLEQNQNVLKNPATVLDQLASNTPASDLTSIPSGADTDSGADDEVIAIQDETNK